MQVPGTRTGHFVYITRGKECSYPGAKPQNHVQILNGKAPLWGFQRKRDPEKTERRSILEFQWPSEARPLPKFSIGGPKHQGV